MENKINSWLTIGLGLIFISILGCSNDEKECPPIVDSVSIIDQSSLNDNSYYLVLRITGFQDKTEILQLFNQKPLFDSCNESQTKPLIEDSLEDYAIKDFSVDLTLAKFLIEYDTQHEASNRQSLKLKIKK